MQDLALCRKFKDKNRMAITQSVISRRRKFVFTWHHAQYYGGQKEQCGNVQNQELMTKSMQLLY